MAINSTLEWTGATWNPIVGCSKYSDGCQNCYAMPIAERLREQGIAGYENGFKLTLRPEKLGIPLHWKKPRLIFVDSMCDLFHDDVPLEYAQKVFAVMKRADWHVYTILTKRARRMRELSPHLEWLPHIVAGATIESDKYIDRLEDLKMVPAQMRYLSLEPLLSPIPRLDLTGIDWVIVGGESGPFARPMNTDWVREIRDWTLAQGKAFWFKQYSEHDCRGAVPPPVLDGKEYKQFPEFKPGNLSLF
ncbi:MAG: phage Gp37/Gp68 family protein [Alphaproteobacteria bacterium]|nr:phage Gp37/Gp68 family protein [Alphaproteobacteria bacterium]MCL2757937.1 phage Gp37/Gp68 family protein [Alphaproteobacteria bacterium]